MKDEIVLIGGGGHCKACIDVIEKEDKYKIAGIIDVKERIDEKVLGYEIFACDDNLLKLTKEYKYFFITIGQIKSAEKRMKIFGFFEKKNIRLPIVISPLAYVSRHAHLEEGTIIMHKAFVNANAKIGKCCIINTGSIIEHDARVGNHCHISTGAIVNGGARVGSRTFIGSNAVIREQKAIGEGSIISCGARIMTDLEKGSLVK